jgi:hypothetical protein
LIPLLTPEQRWYCPNCTLQDVTHEARAHTRFHSCKGLKGLTAPMIPAGTRAKVTVVERQDYIGSEKVQLHNGRPIMSVVTERDNGQDVAIFAPTAIGKANL